MTIEQEVPQLAGLVDIEALAQKSRELDALSDAVGKGVVDFNSALAEAKVHVTVWLEAEDDLLARGHPTSSELAGYQLGWGRAAGHWTALVRRVRGSYTQMGRQLEVVGWTRVEDTFDEPLTNAPRHVRLEALGKFPRLVKELTNKTEQHLTSVRAALALVARGGAPPCAQCGTAPGGSHLSLCPDAQCDCWAKDQDSAIHARECGINKPYEPSPPVVSPESKE